MVYVGPKNWQEYILGLILVFLTSVFWVTSGTITNRLHGDTEFDQPFFLTYVMTAWFALYLPFYTTSLFKTKNDTPCFGLCVSRLPVDSLSFRETFRTSLFFCPVWLGMTFFYNYSLFHTSVGSNTVCSTLSGPFSLMWSVCVLHQSVNWFNLGGVLITVTGAVIISFEDTSDSKKQGLLGDMAAVISAFIYGMYTVLMKRRVGDDGKMKMDLFFGGLGLFNFLTVWPMLLILHFTGLETFRLPSKKVAMILALNGFTNLLSDYCWARSILLTSPVIATVGLSLTLPMALVSDLIFDVSHSWFYYTGCGVMLVGFFLVNFDVNQSLSAREEQQQNLLAENALENGSETIQVPSEFKGL